MRTKDAGQDITHDETLRRIIRVADLYEGDYASASAIRESLLVIGALRRETDESGQTWIVKGDFPDPLTLADWKAREQATIDEIHARDMRMMREDADNREAADRRLAGPSMAEQITELVIKLFAEQVPGMVREAVAEALRDTQSVPAAA
jgi:hypothetical protein